MTLLLFLPPDADSPWRWWRASDEGVMQGDGVPSIGEEERVVAIAPADAVTLHWAALPDRSAAQAVAAARIVVSEASAAPLGDLHVAVGDEGAAERPIGVVGHARMAAWLAELNARDLDPIAILPAPLLLPRPEAGYDRATIAGQQVVRGATSGFADEPGLTELIVGDEEIVTVSPDALARAMALAADAPILDLRQGPFARRRRVAVDWPLIRRLVILGASIMLALLAIDLARIAHYSFGANALELRAEALARQGLPRGSSATGDATRLLDERLANLRGPGLGFSQSAAIMFDAVRAVPGTELTGLGFDARGDLRADVAAEGEAQVNLLQDRLRQSGLNVTASTFEASDGRLSGKFTVKP